MKYITEKLAEALYNARKGVLNESEDFVDVDDEELEADNEEEVKDALGLDEGVNIKKLAKDIMNEYDENGNMEKCVKTCVGKLKTKLSDKEIKGVDKELQKLWDKACAEYDEDYEDGDWSWTRDDGRPGMTAGWEDWFVVNEGEEVDEARWVTMNRNHALVGDKGELLKGGDPKKRVKASKKDIEDAVEDANRKSKDAGSKKK